MQAREITDQPFPIVKLPVKRRFPLLLVDRLPTFRKPPAIIVVAAAAHELEKLRVTDKRAIESEILQENLVRRLLIIKSEGTVNGLWTLDFGLWTCSA